MNQTKSNFPKGIIRNKLKNWFLTNPKYNPYNFSVNYSIRYLTNFIRVLPNVIIIGSSKGGKTSLLSYLNQHPEIKFGTKNSVGTYFFDGSFDNHSFRWYKSHFPTKFSRRKIVGEAPGTYLNHPLVPNRIKIFLPNVKLITILRNPVERAYSAYNHAVRFGWETSSFEDAIEEEQRRIKIENENDEIKINNPNYTNFLQFSYLRHGLYAKNLKPWFELFPKNQFLFLSTDDLKSDPQKIIDTIFNFLNLKSIKLHPIQNKNVGAGGGEYTPIKESTRNSLIDFYKDYNEELYKIINKKFNWNK